MLLLIEVIKASGLKARRVKLHNGICRVEDAENGLYGYFVPVHFDNGKVAWRVQSTPHWSAFEGRLHPDLHVNNLGAEIREDLAYIDRARTRLKQWVATAERC
jgi:hypothetical protein